MSQIADALRRAVSGLDTAGVRFAVVGGLAVTSHGYARLTKDVDLAVAVASDAEAEAVIRRLILGGYRHLANVEQEAMGRLGTKRLISPGQAHPPSMIVDLLFAACGIEPEIVAAAMPRNVLKGMQLPVATRHHLIAMKTLAFDERRRPQDWDDIRARVGMCSPTEIESARDAMRLIEQRGFARGLNLVERFDALIR